MDQQESREEEYHLVGERFGKFLILSELGRGSMGVVLKAFQEGLKREVALKILPANITLDKKHRERFHREAESVGKLNHPNVIQIYDNGVIDKTHYFAMELVDGEDFTSVRCTDRESIRHAARLARDAARGLAHAHAEGVIHRDVKPSNLLVDKKGRVVVTDFGLARVKDSASLTSTDAIVGTPKYMCPEQILPGGQPIDGRADVYSLGATLYECVAGRPPIEAPSVQAFFKAILEERPSSPRKLNKECPHDLATIILRCLEKNPDHRYATATDLADDLERFLAGERILARPKGTVALAGEWVRRHRVIASLTVVAALGLLTTLALSGRVREDTGKIQLLESIDALRTETDVDFAIQAAIDLADKHAGNADVTQLIEDLHDRKARMLLEESQIKWVDLLRHLEGAGKSGDLWYLMSLCELGNVEEARNAVATLPEDSEVAQLTRARLDMAEDKQAEAVARLTGRENPHPFALFVEAQARRVLANRDATRRQQHLETARTLLRRARTAVRVRWLRGQIQWEEGLVKRGLGEAVNLRDTVDDFSVIANQWWDKVSGAWAGVASTKVDDVKVYVGSVLTLAELPRTLAVEMEKKARELIGKTGEKQKAVGHLLLAAAHLSRRDPDAARDAIEQAENNIEEAQEPLLPYVYWGRSLMHSISGDLRLAVANAAEALRWSVSYEKEFGDLEALARHTVRLGDDALKDNKRIEQRRADDALKEQLEQLKAPPAWVSDVLALIAARASASAPSR